jgi:hypothetical protein
MKKVFTSTFAFVFLVAALSFTNELNVQGLNFVQISGQVFGADGGPVANAKIGSRDMETSSMLYTCTGVDGRWNLEVPVDSVSRDLSVFLSNRLTGNSGIDCSTATLGSIPSLGCYSEFGPFVAENDRTINFSVSSLVTRTLRIVDGDGFPVYGASIASRNGQQGPCPISSPQLTTIRAEDNGDDEDINMDGLITVVGAYPSGKDLIVVSPSGTTQVNVNLNSNNQLVVLPMRQSLPIAPIVSLSLSQNQPLVWVYPGALTDLGLYKFTVKLRDGSPVCTISLQTNRKSGNCLMADWLPGVTYEIVVTAWNGKGEGPATSTRHTMAGSTTTSTSAPALAEKSINSVPAVANSVPIAINSEPLATAPQVSISKSAFAKSIAKLAELNVLSGSKVSLKVIRSSAKYCRVLGTTLKGLKAGSCKVAVTVTPKKGKATSKTITLMVTK